MALSISITSTVGAIYTKEYGTAKLDWTISNPDGFVLKSLKIARTVYSPSTITLEAGLGFNPIDPNGSWTDTGLALTKDVTSNRSITYTFTLKYENALGATVDLADVVESIAIPHISAVVASADLLEDYCTDGCWDFGSKKAYATFEGKASLDGEDNTHFVLTTTRVITGAPFKVGFITNSSIVPASGGAVVVLGSQICFTIGTSGANTNALATQALHVAILAANTTYSAMGFPLYSISPASWTNEISITLTQINHGASGNTFIEGTINNGSIYINGVPFNKDATSFTQFKEGRTGSDLSVSLNGYFEDPLTQRSSFDINYCLDKPNADGIGDAEFYLNLPKEANITSFVPNSIISASDVSYAPAFQGAPQSMSNRWKVNIAYPGSGATNFGQGTSSASTKATALFAGKLAINGDTGKTLTIHNTDGSLVTFTTAAAIPSASTATTIGTTGASTDVKATEAFHTAFSAAIGDGTLKATLTPLELTGIETSFTLTQDIVGTIGNTTFTHTGTVITGAHLYINGAVWVSGTSAFGDTTATTAQTAGAPENAYAVFEGKSALTDDNKTSLSIFNEDWSYAYFLTDSDTAYTASYSDTTITVIGTSGIASANDKATESLHIAFTEAIAAGKLNSYYLLPKVYTTGLTSITLIHKTPGTIGNKRLVGDIDDSSLDVNGNDFNTGLSPEAPSSFIGGTDMPPFESHNVSKLLPPSYGKFGTVYIDKPLGDGLISFDAENTRVQVVPEKLPSLYLTFNSDLLNSGAYSPTVATLSGSPTISKTTWKRGAGSLSLDGSSGINIPDTTGATDLDGDFTIDFWVNRNSSTHDFLIGSGGTYGSSTSKQWALSCDSSAIALHYNPAGTWINNSASTSISGWTHIAMVRSSNEVKIYVDGELENTITSSVSSMSFDYSGINIGQPMASAPTSGAADHGDKLDGYIDEFRVIKGLAKWTDEFDSALPFPDLIITNAIYDGTGNMNNKKGSVSFGKVRNDEGVIDVGSSYGFIERSLTDYNWLPIDADYSPDNIWQTGPPLTKCADEINIGYGDHSYHLKAFDSNTFDVEYCLKAGEMDTFIIVCAMTDFKTKIAAVEKQFGDAAGNGWDLSFKNISPGFSIIYGNGSQTIKPAGLQTLLRVYLDSPLIQQNPSTDPDTSVCTYPIFLNLGENNYKQFQQYISEVDTESAKRLLNTDGSLWTQLTGDYQWRGNVLTSDRLSGSGIIKELRWLAWGSDPRISSVATSLADNIERVLKEYSTDADQEAIITNAAAAGHYFRIFFMAYINLIRSLPSIQDKLDFTWNKMSTGVSSLCNFSLDWANTSQADYCSSDDNELIIYIYYGNVFNATSGVEIDFTQLKSIIDASNGITLSDANSWGRKKYNIINNQLNGIDSDGGAVTDQSYNSTYDGEFIQAYNSSTGKYLAVYNAQILSQNIQALNNPYLQNKPSQAAMFGRDILTTIVLDVSGVADKCSGSTMDGLMNSIVTAVNTDLLTAKLVGNELVGKPSSEDWTGESYNIGSGNSVDIKDFLTTTMFALGGTTPSSDLTEAKIESVFILPKSALQADGTHKTVKQYYNLTNLDLTGATYPTGDSLNVIDADGDGKIDILDVVALRNVWVLKDEYPDLIPAANSGLSLVPTEKCVSFNSDIDLLLPTHCSTFCVTPSCFAKTWLSDIIGVDVSADGIPKSYMLEVSYSVDCMDEGSNTVEDISGVQFKVEGLKRAGITRTENGAEDGNTSNATAAKIANWAEHIVNSVSKENGGGTKDTYFAYSTTGDYISKGSGVLCYLVIPRDSLPTVDEMGNEIFAHIVTNKKAGAFKTDDSAIGASYPLANVRFKSFHTDELEIFEKFGLRITNSKITSNRSYNGSAYSNMTSASDSSWVGYDSGSPAVITETHINAALTHVASGTYDAIYDSTGDGTVDVSDIQALAHLLYNGSFSFSTNSVTPRECCPYTAPSIPNLVLIDFKDDVISVTIEGAKKTIEVDIDGNELDCTSMLSGHEGGIFLHWNPVSSADYYIVYRQEPGLHKKGIPIIASSPGGTRAILKDFVKREYGMSNVPTQLATTTWIDFPPALTSGCLDYSQGGSSAAAPPGSGGVVDDTLSRYTYWVDAISRDGKTTSHKIIGSSVSCRYAPTCTDFSFIVSENTTYYGSGTTGFGVAHPFAPSPIGGCYSDSSQTTTGTCLPVWVYAQNSLGGDGHTGISDKKGTIITEGRMPSSLGMGGKNKTGFEYTPREDFVGKDTFKYTAMVKDSENPNDISMWCATTGTVTVYVIPKAPGASPVPFEIGSCCTDDEGKITLTWESVAGAESYFVYRYNTITSSWDKVSTIENDDDKALYEYKEEPSTWSDFKNTTCVSDNTSTLSVRYKVSSTKRMDGTIYEVDSDEVIPVMTCCVPLSNPTLSSSQSGFCGSAGNTTGIVNLTWSAIAGADYYNIYRRGSYTEIAPAALFHFDDTTDACSGGSIALDNTTTTSSVPETFTSAIFATTGANPFNGAGGFATFDGTQYLQIEGPAVNTTCVGSSNSLCLSGEFTMDFWVKFDDASITNSILMNGDGSFPGDSVFMHEGIILAATGLYGSGNHIFHLGTVALGGGGIQLSVPDFVDDTWYHFALTRDSSDDVRGYLDGVQRNWTGSAATFNEPDTWNFDGMYLGVGITAYGLNHLEGALDELRFIKGTAIDFTGAKPQGPYTSCGFAAEYDLVGKATVLSFPDTVTGCTGCSTSNVKYDYYATSVKEAESECQIEGSVHTVTIDCCNTAPVATDQSFDTEFETALTGKVIASDYEGNISSYAFGTPSGGTLSGNTTTGEFTFTPADKFSGDVTFTWTATDACSSTSGSGTVTVAVSVEGFCNPNNFIVCDSSASPYMHEQQDIYGVRQKVDALDLIPKMLSNKGASALRGPQRAYIASMNPNPLAVANSTDSDFGIGGCMDSNYLEYNPLAISDDGSCATLKIYGCTDSTASNYNIYANSDDGTCNWAPPSYTLGADPDVLFHFEGNSTESCSSNIVTATITNAAYATRTDSMGGQSLDFSGGTTTLVIDSNPSSNAADPLYLDGEFTIDFWVYLSATERHLAMGPGFDIKAAEILQCHDGVSSGDTAIFSMLYIDLGATLFGASTEQILLFATLGVSDQHLYELPADPTGAWSHIAVTRDSGDNVRLFLNGTALIALDQSNGLAPLGTSYVDSSILDIHSLGGLKTDFPNPMLGMSLHGELDELRITKGTAIDFTSNVPTASYTCS